MTNEDRDRILQMKPEHVLALTIFGEARGETLFGKIGVAHVVNNRCKDKRWPDTIQGVCIQPKQFSCWNESDPNFQLLLRKSKQGINYDPDLAWRECVWVAGGVIFGYLRDNTSGANHYHTKDVKPFWENQMTKVGEIDHHIFYRG